MARINETERFIRNEELAKAEIERHFEPYDLIWEILEMKDMLEDIIAGGRLSTKDASWVVGQKEALPKAIKRKTEALGFSVYKLSQAKKKADGYAILARYFNEKDRSDAYQVGVEVLNLYNIY